MKYDVKDFLRNIALEDITREDLDHCYDTITSGYFDLFENPERMAFCLKGYYEFYEEYEKCENLKKILENEF